MQVPRYSGAGPDVKCAHNNNLTPTSNQALDARRGGEKLTNRTKKLSPISFIIIGFIIAHIWSDQNMISEHWSLAFKWINSHWSKCRQVDPFWNKTPLKISWRRPRVKIQATMFESKSPVRSWTHSAAPLRKASVLVGTGDEPNIALLPPSP